MPHAPQGNATLVGGQFDRTLAAQEEAIALAGEAADAIKDGIAASESFLRELAATQEFLDSVSPTLLGVKHASRFQARAVYNEMSHCCPKSCSPSKLSVRHNLRATRASRAGAQVLGPLGEDGATRKPCVATSAELVGRYTVEFEIAGESAAVAARRRRRLAESSEQVSAEPSCSVHAGYSVCRHMAGLEYTDLSDAPELPRYVGPVKGGGGNRLLGGLVLNQVRTAMEETACDGRFPDLSSKCAERLFFER